MIIKITVVHQAFINDKSLNLIADLIDSSCILLTLIFLVSICSNVKLEAFYRGVWVAKILKILIHFIRIRNFYLRA